MKKKEESQIPNGQAKRSIFKKRTDLDRIKEIVDLSKKEYLLFDIQVNYKNEFIVNISNNEKLAKRVRVSKERKTDNEETSKNI
ncbi:MAG: hypothetical protein QW042_05025 [Thermoplasmata archaeon]